MIQLNRPTVVLTLALSLLLAGSLYWLAVSLGL